MWPARRRVAGMAAIPAGLEAAAVALAIRLVTLAQGQGPRLAALALVAVVAAACTPPEAAPRLPRPGEVLFVRAERRAALQRTPAARAAWCASTAVPGLAFLAEPPVAALAELEDAPDAAAEPFARALMVAAAAGFGSDDPAARRTTADLLARWAEAGALAGAPPDSTNQRYALDRALLPTIAALWLVGDDRSALPPMRRAAVTSWLGRLIAARDSALAQAARPATTDRNNHRYLRASVDMAWGALTGDATAFAAGPAAFRQALASMRADGSLPLETRRGARALWYQRHALASLIAIAEMAAVQEINLYGLAPDGRSLHRGVRFLLDGIADPRRVWHYARANDNPGPESDPWRQDLRFLEPRGHGRHYMAWAEPYLARFPDRPESRRLRALVLRPDGAPRPLIDDYSGGNTTCFYAAR